MTSTSQITTETIGPRVGEAVARLRRDAPLVQCLTNIVVAQVTANVLLAAGATPAMVDNSREAEDFAAAASATLVNTGTPYPETAAGMEAAVRGATAADHPWVLDPVAAGMAWRTGIACSVLALGTPAIIRANASEVLALAGGASTSRGPDAGDTVESARGAACELATRHGCVVAMSGPTDHLTDGTRTITCSAGHEWMTRVTGIGCSLGALMAAFAAVEDDALVAAASATSMMCVAAERAARASRGPGGFAVALLDELFLVPPEAVGEEGGLDVVAS